MVQNFRSCPQGFLPFGEGWSIGNSLQKSIPTFPHNQIVQSFKFGIPARDVNGAASFYQESSKFFNSGTARLILCIVGIEIYVMGSSWFRPFPYKLRELST